MFWMITALGMLGVAGVSLFATMNRLGGTVEKAFKAAPALTEAQIAEGAYGKITGIASSTKKIPVAPGLELPCLVYELVVHEQVTDRSSSAGWRVVHSEVVAVDIEIAVGNTIVRVNGHDIYLVSGPVYDSQNDLRTGGPAYGSSSRIRFVPPGATVHVVGTLTREVDNDPGASRDYRSVATRYRMIGKRNQPIALAADLT
ncbi:MAG: hypothetical protein ABI175_30605 [Polyangiales bacterium]